jgi:hypothetical protein
MKKMITGFLAFSALVGSHAFARGGNEDQFIISNGQGVSSPSYWNSLEGQNPAGIVLNNSNKAQFGFGSFSGTDQRFGSGGLILGNGVLAAGVEYLNHSSANSAKGQMNWALGGRIEAVRTSLGISSRMSLVSGSTGVYDIGLLSDLGSSVRFGLMIPNFTNTIQTVGAGLAIRLNATADLVVDADYNTSVSGGMVKPGLSFHSQSLHASVAYGLNYSGKTVTLLADRFTAGLGVKLANALLFSYEYRGVVEHRLGLTLRFN